MRSSADFRKSISTQVESALHVAVSSNDREKVKELIKLKDIDLNCVNSLGLTPLMLAASDGSLKICEMLLEVGADVTKAAEDGSVALTLLLKLGVPPSALYLKVLTLLADKGRMFFNRIYKRDRLGEGLLHSAAARPNAFNLHFLLLNGADPNAKTE
jgi:ankyrin repeat protein